MIDDPTIRDVLKEMDAEVAAVTALNRPSQQQQHQHHQQQQAPPLHSHHAPPPNYPFMPPPPSADGGFDPELAKRALIAAILAAAIFHPMLSQVLGARVPLLATNELYMAAARVILLALVFYVLMWKLDL